MILVLSQAEILSQSRHFAYPFLMSSSPHKLFSLIFFLCFIFKSRTSISGFHLVFFFSLVSCLVLSLCLILHHFAYLYPCLLRIINCFLSCSSTPRVLYLSHDLPYVVFVSCSFLFSPSTSCTFYLFNTSSLRVSFLMSLLFLEFFPLIPVLSLSLRPPHTIVTSSILFTHILPRTL